MLSSAPKSRLRFGKLRPTVDSSGEEIELCGVDTWAMARGVPEAS